MTVQYSREHRRFRPTLFATLLTLVGMAIAARLGVWQIDRAHQKTALIEQFERGTQQVVEFTAGNAASLPRYQRVHFSGRYDARHQVLLDNMPSQSGRPGFRVLTPLELTTGRSVLVDRGWVPMGASRDELPQVDVGEQVRDVVGRLDELPVPGLRMGDDPLAGEKARWPLLLNYPRRGDLESVLERPLLEPIVRLDAAQPDGYERDWNPSHGFGPERHIAYAVQWFALAAAMLIVYLILNFKRVEPHGDAT